jgi:methyltransferase (TIGR00027 family)
MRDGRASKTAEHNALFRALEAGRPAGRRLFDDPYVHRFLSLRFRAALALGGVAVGLIDRGWPGVRATVVARTRLIDELVLASVDDVDQVVILGAGFDTRAYRLPALRVLPVVEVDHPDTQRRKRARLGPAPDNVRFVPTDFRFETLGPGPTVRTLFLWEGVTNYLTESAVDATLRWCAGAPAGSHLVVTYIDRGVLTDPGQFFGATRVFSTLRRAGEEMTFGIGPAELSAYLSERGLELLSDEGAADFRRRYLGPGADEIRGHEFYRVAHARIG